MNLDIFDVLILLGLVILGLAIGLTWGWVSSLAYGGVVLVAAGAVGVLTRVGSERR